ncbi:hypothetical protein [Pseudochryseolinea flava]|uniref:DUF4890 domain-containing protein n=1 Tax=Pseudochryseolinea flava TaxID=2059302 RepID=A0A364Y1Q9_9BACT|nr:hypothetical protein [Pseudochryseolinea flava]RAW00597.1 hypothetical protein DQQ10_13460 [Pseudochryseolinea flava]
MKKSFVFGICVMMCTMVFAQHQGSYHRHDKVALIDKMKTELTLSEEQYASIKSINEKYHAKRVAVRKDSAIAKEEKSKTLKSLQESRRKEMNTVLTPAQSEKWKTLQQQQKQQRRADRQKEKAERAAKLKETLSLTDDQLQKMEAVNKTFHSKVKASRKEGQYREVYKETMKKQRDEHQNEIKTILTPAQFEKYQALKKENREHRKAHKKK